MSCLNQIFKQLKSIVGLSPEFARVLKEKPLLSFRRRKNLKDHLVKDHAEKGVGKIVWLNVIRSGAKFVILSDREINLRVTLRVGPTMLTTFLIVIRRELCI